MHLCFEPIGTILLISYHLHFTAIADCVHHVLLHTKILCVLSHQLPWQQRMRWVFFSCNLSQVNFEQFDFRQLFDTCLDCSSQTSSCCLQVGFTSQIHCAGLALLTPQSVKCWPTQQVSVWWCSLKRYQPFFSYIV